jgi:hypothetical protein
MEALMFVLYLLAVAVAFSTAIVLFAVFCFVIVCTVIWLWRQF